MMLQQSRQWSCLCFGFGLVCICMGHHRQMVRAKLTLRGKLTASARRIHRPARRARAFTRGRRDRYSLLAPEDRLGPQARKGKHPQVSPPVARAVLGPKRHSLQYR
jgi:hypothetical protein